MQGDKIKVGIIGLGNIAQNEHIPAFKKRDDVEILAVCDINENRAKAVAESNDIKYAVKNVNDLLNINGLDAVSICSWSAAHAEAAIAAANSGKHILCEKPMAASVAEAQTMLNAARDNKIIFMMGFVNRFRPESKCIKKMADAGSFGEIYYSKTGWLRRRGAPLGWYTNKSKSSGGPVFDIGVHVIDLTWYFMGKPKPVSVSATTYRKISNYNTEGVERWKAFDADNICDTEDSAAGLIRFENGSSMSFEVSWAINGKESGIYSNIYGSKAGATLFPLTIYDEKENYLMDSTPVIANEDIFYNEISHFIECVKSGTQPICPVEDGFTIQKILNGIYESAESGKEILLF